MTESISVPMAPTKSGNKGALVAVIIALVGLAAAAYEYQQNAKTSALLKEMNEQFAKLQHDLNSAQVDLAKTTDQLNELQQRNMPVTLIYRRAANGGMAITFKNNAPTPLQMSVLMTNPINHHSREANLSIPANGVQSIGEAEGWAFEPGHRIRLTTAELGSVEYVVPQELTPPAG